MNQPGQPVPIQQILSRLDVSRTALDTHSSLTTLETMTSYAQSLEQQLEAERERRTEIDDNTVLRGAKALVQATLHEPDDPMRPHLLVRAVLRAVLEGVSYEEQRPEFFEDASASEPDA